MSNMNLDVDSCYQAIVTHDARFDGVIFVGVATTGVYCRTICPAKTPRRQSCRFFPSAAAAEGAGFRPCLRCRPELAPGNARVDAVNRLAATIASRIEDGVLTEGNVEQLAEELHISERHLRRVTQRTFGVSPIELAQTQRLLLAKRLLTDTNLSVIDAAFASGFASLRRFNALFKQRYRLNPTDLRKRRSIAPSPADTFTCEVAYRPPLDWKSMLSFLDARSLRGVEVVDGQKYSRTVHLGKHVGWITIQPAKNRNRLTVELSASLIQSVLPALARVKRLFDLSADPKEIAEHLGTLASKNPGLRVPGAFDGFEVGVRAILGQQVSVKAARTLAGRLIEALGENVETPIQELTHIFPRPEQILQSEPRTLAELGILPARVQTIRGLAKAIAGGKLSLEPGVDPEETIRLLCELPGVGEWTAHYIAMRAMNWPDAFPHTDLGIRKALKEDRAKRVLEIAEAWRPWRSYAVMHLWKSLEN
jgi:AraC family transcriptional regulator of adaptative response / DNA-3-methyladenine glycosylase II